jgi:hypothetical protein
MHKSQSLKSAQGRSPRQSRTFGAAGRRNFLAANSAISVSGHGLISHRVNRLNLVRLAKTKALRDLDVCGVCVTVGAALTCNDLSCGAKKRLACAVSSHSSLLRPRAPRAPGFDVMSVLFARAVHGLVLVFKNTNQGHSKINNRPKSSGPKWGVRRNAYGTQYRPKLPSLHTASPILPIGCTRVAGARCAKSGQIFQKSSGRNSWRVTSPAVAFSMATQYSAANGRLPVTI